MKQNNTDQHSSASSGQGLALLPAYFALAIRSLMKNKLQSLFSIVGLAVAFFCFGLCAYFVHGLTATDEWSVNGDRLLRLQQRNVKFLRLTDEEYKQLQSLYEVESVCRFWGMSSYWQYGEEQGNINSVSLHTTSVDTTFHSMYDMKLKAGSWNDVILSEFSFAMSEYYAVRLFGSVENAIGRSITNYPNSYTIRAVVENMPPNNSIAPFTNVGGWIFNDGGVDQDESFKSYSILTRKGVSRQEAIATINSLNMVGKDNASVWAVKPTPIPALSYKSDNSEGMLIFYYSVLGLILLSLGLLILLSALSNFFHLLLSNIMMRRREYVLRRAHGAHTFDLWLMVSTQVIITLMLVGLVSLLIVEIATPLLKFSVAGDMEFFFFPRLMLIQDLKHIGVLLLVGLLVAWIAVARVRKDSLQEAMKTSTGVRPRRHVFRNVLLCWQLIVGSFFVTILCALYLQFNVNEQSTLPMFSKEEKEDILILNGSISKIVTEAQLQSMPEIEQFVCCKYLLQPDNISHTNLVNSNHDTVMVQCSRYGHKELEFCHIELTAGQWAETEEEIVIDQILSQKYGVAPGDEMFTTMRYLTTNEKGELVETVDEKHYVVTGVVNTPTSAFLSNLQQNRYGVGGFYVGNEPANGFSNYWVKCKPGTLKQVQQQIAKIYAERTDNELPKMNSQCISLSEVIKLQYSKLEQFKPIFWLFSFIALGIALLGIYSAITVDTSYRRKEMAIRKIHGAKARHIAMRFARLYLILLSIAAFIAFPGCYILIQNAISNGFNVIFYHGFFFYAGIFLLMALFIALTVGEKVWSIARINPSTIVKSE